MVQATYVQRRLASVGVASEVLEFVTSGDRQSDVALDVLGGQGVFALELQWALLNGDADVAVHSAKDLPSSTPDGLVLACVPERRDPADVLIGRSLAGLGPGATVATGSPRRRALLLERRPDLRVIGLRGNMATRFAVVGKDGVDAIVAASAAVERLGRQDVVSERLDPEWFVPQVGQGSLALEARADDAATNEVLAEINDVDAKRALDAERAFLRELGTGCSIPAGALAMVVGSTLKLRGVMLALDGARSVRAEIEGTDPSALGRSLALLLRDEHGGGSLQGWANA